MNKKHKCVIVGSGPAGYTAAIYAARAGMEPLLISGPQPGGLLTTTGEVENFPGYPKGIDGMALTMDLHEQACRFGTEILADVVRWVDFSAERRLLEVGYDGLIIDAETVIIATGSSPRKMGVPGEERLYGSGVSSCAVCDGFFYRGQDVVVVGGGDSACEEALYLSNICNSVTLLVRGNKLRASKIMQDRVKANQHILVHYNTRVEEVLGEQAVEGVRAMRRELGGAIATFEVPCTGVFVAIGHVPQTDPFKGGYFDGINIIGGGLEMDGYGYIVTEKGSTKTSVPGVFAAGDCQDKIFRQAITAAGTGCMAALEAERYLSERHD